MIPLAALLVLCLARGVPPGSAQSSDEIAVRRASVVRLLDLEAGAFDVPATSRGLAALGVVPELIEVLAQGGLPAGWRADDAPFVGLDETRLGAVHAAFVGAALPVLRAQAERVLAEDPRPEARAVLVDALGQRGEHGDLALLGRLCALDLEPAAARALGRTLETALDALLARDPGAIQGLAAVFDPIGPALRPRVSEVLVRTGRRAALGELASFLARHPDSDVDLLYSIVRLAEGLVPPYPEEVLARVRSFVESPAPLTAQVALRACGVLGDREAIPSLVEALETPDESLRAGAARALRDLTHLAYGPDAGAWRAWLESEKRWWETRAPRLLEDLDGGDAARATRALTGLAGHPLHADEIAHTLGERLGRSEDALAIVVCQALRQLDSPAVLPQLVECLDHPSGEVRQAAWATLQALTGKNLPPQRELWLPLLDPAARGER